MNVEVIVPSIGEGVEELAIVAWKKKPGDRVAAGEGLVEVESDKVTTELPSPAAGILAEILAAEGDRVAAGSAIARIDTAGAGAADSEGAPVPAARAGSPAAAASAAAPPASAHAAEPSVRPHSAMRRRIAERMIASQATSAHVLTVAEADMSAVVAHRAAVKEGFAREGVRLTLSAYFSMALAGALKRFPDMNASWSEEGLVLHPEVNLGLAVSLGDGGLVVPVIRRADELDLLGSAREIGRLSEAARAGTLEGGELRGGTFTLTNYGTTGSLIAAPIINQPQLGILGAGSVSKRPVVVTGEDGADAIAIRPMVYLSLVFDHRALDGEAASRFLRAVVEALEGWAR
jgi:2-oxoglutarate dehydrogenase E2 component (dihydrolipoamide succinyltransferase)